MAEQLALCGCGHNISLHSEAKFGCLIRTCECQLYVDSDDSLKRAKNVEQLASGSAPHVNEERSPQRVLTTRERLPDERASYTKAFKLRYHRSNGDSDVMRFYFTASTYEDGRVGEVFIKADKTGSLARGALDIVAVLISLLLQHGVPLEDVVSKLKGTRFPPASFTGDGNVPNCSSPLDLLARWLEHRFLRPSDSCGK